MGHFVLAKFLKLLNHSNQSVRRPEKVEIVGEETVDIMRGKVLIKNVGTAKLFLTRFS